MFSGKHPIAGLRQPAQNGTMTLISRYPLGASQQELLAALMGSPQPLLTEKPSISSKPGPSDGPSELRADFEDPPNCGMGE